MSNAVALLGTKGGPAIRPGSTMPTSSLLTLGGRRIVVDCGLGVARGLVDQGMQLKDLELIFITHLHSDHYLELGPAVAHRLDGRAKDRCRYLGASGVEYLLETFHRIHAGRYRFTYCR